MGKDSFVIYKSFYKPISKLSDKQLGRLFRAIFEYNISGVVSVEDDIEMAFGFFKNQFEIDEDKYQSKVERNRENGRRGGNQRAENNNQANVSERYQTLPNATERKRTIANQADNENDNENDLNNSPSISPSKGECDAEFDKFWDMYDKKRGDKAKVKAKFCKLSRADKDKIFSTLPTYVASTPDKTYRKDPMTYLNNKSWNDEIIDRNGTRQQSTANRQSNDLSQFRDPNRHYATESDF